MHVACAYFCRVSAITRPAELFVSTSVFTAFCALGLCLATERLLAPCVLPIFSALHMVIFGSTLAVYNLPRLLPRPYGELRKPQPLRPAYVFFFICGIAMLLSGIMLLGTRVMTVCAILGLLAFAYFIPSLPFRKKRLRDFGLLKIVVLTGVWTATTALLPMLYLNAPIAHYPFELLLRFVFVFALCILFDIRDMETDNSRNIATLPNRIGVDKAYKLTYIAMAVFVLLSGFQYLRFHDGGRLLAAIATALATAFVTDYVRRHPGHNNFVAMTDGMMLLYAILVLLQ